jgi:hypothetical protein
MSTLRSGSFGSSAKSDQRACERGASFSVAELPRVRKAMLSHVLSIKDLYGAKHAGGAKV